MIDHDHHSTASVGVRCAAKGGNDRGGTGLPLTLGPEQALVAIGAGWVELRRGDPFVEGLARGLGAARGAVGTATTAATATATATTTEKASSTAVKGGMAATAKATRAANNQALKHPQDQLNLNAGGDDRAATSGYDGGGNSGGVDGGGGSDSDASNMGGAHGGAQWWMWVMRPFRQLGLLTSELTAAFGFSARKRPRPDEDVDGANGASGADGTDGAQGGQTSRKRQRREPLLATGAAATGEAAADLASSGGKGGLEEGSRVGSRMKSKTSALLDPLFSVETHRLMASAYTYNFDEAGSDSGWVVETDIVRLACFVDMWRRGYVLGVSRGSSTAHSPCSSSEEPAYCPTTNCPGWRHTTSPLNSTAPVRRQLWRALLSIRVKPNDRACLRLDQGASARFVDTVHLTIP